MSLKNIEIRKMIADKRVHYYEVAEKIGIDSCTFSRWLQVELTQERTKRIIKALNEFK